MKFKKILLSIILMIFLFPLAFAQQMTPTGTWEIRDSKTGKKRALIHIVEAENVLKGTIIKIYKQPGDTGICSKCPGDFKNKPIPGLQILWDVKEQGVNNWENGKILDPQSGRIYRAKVTLTDGKLQVRGYVGIAALGKTQIWIRH